MKLLRFPDTTKTNQPLQGSAHYWSSFVMLIHFLLTFDIIGMNVPVICWIYSTKWAAEGICTRVSIWILSNLTFVEETGRRSRGQTQLSPCLNEGRKLTLHLKMVKWCRNTTAALTINEIILKPSSTSYNHFHVRLKFCSLIKICSFLFSEWQLLCAQMTAYWQTCVAPKFGYARFHALFEENFTGIVNMKTF